MDDYDDDIWPAMDESIWVVPAVPHDWSRVVIQSSTEEIQADNEVLRNVARSCLLSRHEKCKTLGEYVG